MQLVRSKLQSIQVSVMHKSAASPTLPGKKTPDTGFGATWEAILGKPFLWSGLIYSLIKWIIISIIAVNCLHC